MGVWVACPVEAYSSTEILDRFLAERRPRGRRQHFRRQANVGASLEDVRPFQVRHGALGQLIQERAAPIQWLPIQAVRPSGVGGCRQVVRRLLGPAGGHGLHADGYHMTWLPYSCTSMR